MNWEAWRERLGAWVCRYLGHKKPYERKMWCRICPRCRVIVK